MLQIVCYINNVITYNTAYLWAVTYTIHVHGEKYTSYMPHINPYKSEDAPE